MEDHNEACNGTDKLNILTSTIHSTPMDNVHSHDVCDGGHDDASLSDFIIAVPSSRRDKAHRCIKDNIFLWIAIFAVAKLIILNWVLMVILSRSMEEGIKDGLILRENTSASWAHPRVNAFLYLYLFRISEPDDEIPEVTEIGPYVYRVDIQKTDITWHSNFSVSYRERYTIFYDAELSIGPEPRLQPNMVFIRNGSVGPVFNVYTGESKFSQIYQIFSWNYATKLPFWNSDEANEIRGTDGSMFQPFPTENTKLTLFYPQLVRKFDLAYSESTTFKDLPVYRFTITDSAFSNTPKSRSSTSEREGNSAVNYRSTGLAHEKGNGFCVPNCVPSGLYSMSAASNGIPLYISLPHFLGAEPYYHQLVKGLQPEESKHRPIFEVDKLTGLTVNQKRRFQINVHQQNGNNSEVYLPLCWVELSIEVTDEDLQKLQRMNRSFKTVYGICIGVGLALSSLLVAMVSRLIYMTVKRRIQPNKYVPLTVQSRKSCCRPLQCCQKEW